MALLRSRKSVLTAGFICGIAFGFLVQRAHVTYYDVIVGVLLFADFTILKVMFTAIAVGMVGVHLLVDLGIIELQPKETALGSNIIGGLIFGAGFALLGYCPGTALGAAGQGNLDALTGGIPGMLVGAAVFSFLYPRLRPILNWRNYGKVTIPQLLKMNHWLVIVPVVVLISSLLALIEGYAP